MITGHTKIYAIMATPLPTFAHRRYSMSSLQQHNLDAVLIPIHVASGRS